MSRVRFDLDTLKRLAQFAAQRSSEDRIPQVAGSLTFTTMLALVPLATVAFALFTAFPIFSFVPDVAADFSRRPSDARATEQSDLQISEPVRVEGQRA